MVESRLEEVILDARREHQPARSFRRLRHHPPRSAGSLGVLGAAVAAGAAGWGLLEGTVALRQTVQSWHKSVCRFCGTGCGVLVGMKDSHVVDVRGDELAHNKGVICIKGSMLPELTRIAGRLTSPKIRKNGALVDASWDEAMGLVASKFSEAIRDYGPDSVAFYGSGQLFTEESYTANKLFKAGIRTNKASLQQGRAAGLLCGRRLRQLLLPVWCEPLRVPPANL